jgi:carboxymethylenebutenolidase
MIEQTIDIATKHGATATFIVHPERHGPHPVVLFFMDAPAIREERRLATTSCCRTSITARASWS